jgi:uncharacterized membrane protein YraQ (UPF0718 family)
MLKLLKYKMNNLTIKGDNMKYKKAMYKSLKNLTKSLPIMLCIIVILGIIKVFISYQTISTLFIDNKFFDPIIGSFIGSIMAGNSLNSYIMGEEFLNNGISIYAVSAFLISWVTVGFIQIPLEAKELGPKFTLFRNIFAIISSIIIGLIIGYLMGVL